MPYRKEDLSRTAWGLTQLRAVEGKGGTRPVPGVCDEASQGPAGNEEDSMRQQKTSMPKRSSEQFLVGDLQDTELCSTGATRFLERHWQYGQ